MAEGSPGFLGGGWVRPRRGSVEWHMLCRFTDDDALAEMTRTERRTGIEGWFDAPETVSAASSPTPPPRRTQAVTIWLVFFPLNLFATVTLGVLIDGWPVLARVAVITLVVTSITTHLLLPWVTRRLGWWLQGRRWRDRRDSSVGHNRRRAPVA